MNSALFTDFYELTMAQGFWKKQINRRSVFEMFFRRLPFHGGFAVFAGLDPLIDAIESFSFSDDDIAWLRRSGLFEEGFLQFLAEFRFSGSLRAVQEGAVVFPHEPIIQVEAPLIEALLLEGLILNTINFQSLIATKTARIWLAAKKGAIMEFGLRRAQGSDGAMSASRAAYIGGASGTSNTLAAKRYGIPAMGTMAHAWVMAFPNEEEAFREYARQYPRSSTFLIDTYDTLRSGLPQAITVAKELKAQGNRCGIRLDSGDIQYLSGAVKKALLDADLPDVTIAVSNELNENIIEHLVHSGAPIDFWGVGTQMVTGGSESSLSGVYKLVARKTDDDQWQPVMKRSDNPAKMTLPGAKQVWRLYDAQGFFKADIISGLDETINAGEEQQYYHPYNEYQRFSFGAKKTEALLSLKMENGRRSTPPVSPSSLRTYREAQLDLLHETSKRILNPHVYKVSLNQTMQNVKKDVLEKMQQSE